MLNLFVFGINQRSVCRWLRQWWLLFVLLEVDATLCDGCRIWEHFLSFWEMNLSRVFIRLYGCVCKILRLTNIIVEFSVVVMSVDYQAWTIQVVSRRKPLFDSHFYKICIEKLCEYKFVMLFQDSYTGGSSLITTRIEYLRALQF